MRRIESRSNPLIVATGKLASKKYREETRTFFFEGAHLLEEYLRFGHIPQYVFVMDGAEQKYAELLSKVPAQALVSVPESVFSKLSTEQAPQGILTVSAYLDSVIGVTHADQTPRRVLLLQSVRDNGNVGTVIRTAAALDWTVVLSDDCADVYASKTVRATMGALFARGVCICKDPVSYVQSFAPSGRRTFAAALGNQSCLLGRFALQSDDLFAVGNEGQGISAALQNACTQTVLIPMTDCAESLNASIASAVIMWEGARGGTP